MEKIKNIIIKFLLVFTLLTFIALILSGCFFSTPQDEKLSVESSFQLEEESKPEKKPAELDEFTGVPDACIVSKLKVPGQAIDVDISGGYAYLTNDLGVLYVVNVEDRENPFIVGKCPGISSANIVIVKDSYAYVSYTEWKDEQDRVFTKCGFKIIDISDSEHPEVAGDYDTSEDNEKTVYGMYIYGDYAYINSSIYQDDKEDSMLEIIDISDKKNPEMTGSCKIKGSLSNLCVSGNFAYIGSNIFDYEKREYTEESSLIIVDISDKKNPEVISSTNVLPNCWAIYVSGDFAYISSNVWDMKNDKYTKSTFQVVDIKDSSNPRTLGKCEIPGGAWEIDLAGSFVYVSSLTGGLFAVDASDSKNPTVADKLKTGGTSYDITISGNYGYIADGFEGLVIARLSDGLPESDGIFADESTNSAPEAVIDVFGDTMDGDFFQIKNPVYFSAVNSFDPDYDELSYKWEINGIKYSDRESISYYFDETGTCEVVLIVSDGDMTSTKTETVSAVEKDLPLVLKNECDFTVEIEYILANNGPGDLKDIECFMKTPQTYYPFQIINNITPSVSNTEELFDNNWNLLTHFYFDGKLPEGEELSAALVVDITMYEFDYAEFDSSTLYYDEGDSDLEIYTEDDLFVDSDSPVIRSTAASVIGDETSPAEIAKRLYNFVASRLYYDYERAKDRDYELLYASEILERGKGICADYAILYTALLRSAGIPARLAAGIPVNTIMYEKGYEIDVGHAWVEVKLPGYGWIPIDITQEDRFLSTNYYLDVVTEKGPGYLYKNMTMDWRSYYYDGFISSWDGSSEPDTEQTLVYRVKDLSIQDVK